MEKEEGDMPAVWGGGGVVSGGGGVVSGGECGEWRGVW